MRVREQTLPLDLPAPAPQPATGNEVAIVDAMKDRGKAHRPKDERPYQPGPRPLRAQRKGRAASAAYDGDQRATRCGWTLSYTRHMLVAQVDPAELCRTCWPAGTR